MPQSILKKALRASGQADNLYPRIQFKNIHTSHWHWSDDYGRTWNEPEHASVAVMTIWFRVRDAALALQRQNRTTE